MKVRLQHPGGWWVDRVPAWVRWATVEPGKMGAKYDGIMWDPPAEQRHRWRASLPPCKPLCPPFLLMHQPPLLPELLLLLTYHGL